LGKVTTIATDGKIMAGDTLTTAGGYVVRHAVKVHRATDGRIFGCCGPSVDALKFKAWMTDPAAETPKLGDDFTALILNVDGTVDWIDCALIPVKSLAPAAIGSGCELAIGAMLAGANPAQAVGIAGQRDTGTGGEITIEALV
jgi:ATP-dependent protease HslVU (ClpYQ) peptidase subunit